MFKFDAAVMRATKPWLPAGFAPLCKIDVKSWSIVASHYPVIRLH